MAASAAAGRTARVSGAVPAAPPRPSALRARSAWISLGVRPVHRRESSSVARMPRARGSHAPARAGCPRAPAPSAGARGAPPSPASPASASCPVSQLRQAPMAAIARRSAAPIARTRAGTRIRGAGGAASAFRLDIVGRIVPKVAGPGPGRRPATALFSTPMPADRLRFRPPAVAPTAAIRWLLLRAFGPAAAALPEPGGGGEAGALARLFEVSPRIAGRNSLSTLTAELGSAAAAELRRDHLLEVGREMRLWELVRGVAAVAGALGIHLVLLKLAALLAAGAVRPGSRGACDVDLLVPRERARELQEALVAGGWTSSK